MKTKIFVLGTLMIVSSVIFAQNTDKRIGIELNTGLSFPVTELNGNELNHGFGIEVIFYYSVMPHIGLFVGWSRNRLEAEEIFDGDGVCFEKTAPILGLQFMHPIFDSRFSFYLRAAGLHNHNETENTNDDNITDSQHEFACRLGVGINYCMPKNCNLNTAVKYNSLSHESEY